VNDDARRRLQAAFLRRERAARHQLLQSAYRVDDADDDADDGPVTNYGKALAHRDDGVPTASAYASLVAALDAGTVEAYNAVDLDEQPGVRSPIPTPPTASRGWAPTRGRSTWRHPPTSPRPRWARN
jgi:hypothetical protein